MDGRAELRELRKQRRQLKKAQKHEEQYQQQLQQLRKPKGEKISIINQSTFEKIQNLRETESKSVKNKYFRASTSIGFSLADFIVVKKTDSTPKRPKLITSKTRKGKQKEFPVKRTVTKLKRAILSIRDQRRKELEADNQQLVQPKPQCNNSNGVAHSRRYRDYCDHLRDPQITETSEALLKDLFRFQKRAYEKNEIKARAHQRYVVGFSQTLRSLDTNKIKILLLAPDLEPSPGPGGIDEMVANIKEKCKRSEVFYCFPLPRRRMGYLLLKKAPISCVAVLDYSGAEEHVKKIRELVDNHREMYSRLDKLTINN